MSIPINGYVVTASFDIGPGLTILRPTTLGDYLNPGLWQTFGQSLYRQGNTTIRQNATNFNVLQAESSSFGNIN